MDIYESVINLHFTSVKIATLSPLNDVPLPPRPVGDETHLNRGKFSASFRRCAATISMQSHDLISQTRYVRDVRQLWISMARSKGFPNVAERRERDRFVLQRARAFAIPRARANRYPALNGVTRYRPRACFTRIPLRDTSSRHSDEPGEKRGGGGKIVRISAIGPIRSVERYGLSRAKSIPGQK